VGAANVFGFILDQNGNSAAAVNLQGGSRTVLAPIVEPVPPGTSQVRSSLHRRARAPGHLSGPLLPTWSESHVRVWHGAKENGP
jgi:hypothetical protein